MNCIRSDACVHWSYLSCRLLLFLVNWQQSIICSFNVVKSTFTFVRGPVWCSGWRRHGHAPIWRRPVVSQSMSSGSYRPIWWGPSVSSVQGHGCGHVGGRERLVGLLLEALCPQVQQRVEGWGRYGRRRFDPHHRCQGELFGVGRKQGLGGVAVRQRGQGEESDGGRRVHAGERWVVMSGEGEGEVSAGRRGAATETSRSLEETLLLLTLLLSEVLLVLQHLRTTSGHIKSL